MSTPAELAQQALTAYHATTVSRPQWEINVKKGVYTPPDGSETNWGQADALLAQIINPSPPPTVSTRLVYVNSGTDASVSALVPALAAASYNTVYIAGGWTSTIAALKAHNMNGWVTLGQFSNGAFTMSQADAVALAQQVAATLPGAPFYLADEPTVGNTAYAALILGRAQAIRSAVPGARCMIAYYDADSVDIYGVSNAAKLPPLDLIAADIYPNKFSFNWDLCTELGDACTKAGLGFTGITAIASDTQPIPSPTQAQQNIATWKNCGSQGFGVYAWGLGAEQSQYVAAVQAE